MKKRDYKRGKVYNWAKRNPFDGELYFNIKKAKRMMVYELGIKIFGNGIGSKMSGLDQIM